MQDNQDSAGIQGILPFGIRSPRLWNTELCSGESGIPLTIGIWNPSLTDMESTLKIQNPRQFWIRAFCLTLSAAIPILIATKRSFEIQKELNSHRTGLEKQQGLRFIVLGNQ